MFFDLKLNSKCGHIYHKKRLCLQDDSSNAFPGKCFVQYKLKINLFYCMKHNELPGIHRRIVHVCAEKQSAVKPRDAIGEKEEAALIAVSWTNTHISLPLPYRLDYPPKSQSFSYFKLITVYFCLFYFSNSILHIFVTIIIIIGCLGIFRNVPGCSMFLVLLTAHLVTTN